MEIINRITQTTIALCLLFMVYTQYNFIRASWCEYEIEKMLFTLDDIEEKLNANNLR